MGSLDAVGAAHPAFISGDVQTPERGGVESRTPQCRKGKLSLRGAGLTKGVTLGGRVGRAPRGSSLSEHPAAGGAVALGPGRPGEGASVCGPEGGLGRAEGEVVPSLRMDEG